MTGMEEIENITKQIYESYLELSEYKVMQLTNNNLNKEDYELEIDNLKFLILREKLLYERYYEKWNPEEITDFLNKEVTDDDMLSKRIKQKIIYILNDPEVLSKEAISQLETEYNIVISNDEKSQIHYEIRKQLEQEEFKTEGPDTEVLKNFITFLIGEIEKETDEMVLRYLVTELYLDIFSDTRLEGKLLDSKFKMDKNWIRISDSITLDEDDYDEYMDNLMDVLNFKTNNALAEIFEESIGDEAYNQAVMTLLKCELRSIMYALDDKQFKRYVKYLNNVKKSNSDEVGVKIIEEAIEEAYNDRKMFPKIEEEKKTTELEMIEDSIYNLYEYLIDYQKRRYNGEDVDYEIQKIIDSIRIKRVLEYDALKRELLDGVDYEDLEYGDELLLGLKLKPDFPEMQDRISSLLNLFAQYFTLKLTGYSEIDIALKITYDDYFEISKNILFFFDEAIKNNTGEVRDFLIEAKFLHIYGNYYLEEEALENNFEISKENLRFPKTIGMDLASRIDYHQKTRDNVLELMISEIGEFYSLDKEITPCIEGEFERTVAILRGALYTLNDRSYEIGVQILEQSLDSFDEYATKLLMGTVAELSSQDREKYPKLVF